MECEVEGFWRDWGDWGAGSKGEGLRRWDKEARKSCGKITRFAMFL